MIEVLKQALEALIQARKLRFALWRHGCDCRDEHTCNPLQDEYAKQFNDSIIKLEQAIAELESQEPMGWHLIEALYPQGERLDIRMGDGSILCNLLPQADGDLWWDGSGTGEKFIDPVYADVTHWRIHSNTHPPQRTWVGLTDEEVEGYWDWEDFQTGAGRLTIFEMVRDIEAKLKQKNGFVEEKNT